MATVYALGDREELIIYNLLSERYHELEQKTNTRDEKTFQEIEDLLIKFGRNIKHKKEV